MGNNSNRNIKSTGNFCNFNFLGDYKLLDNSEDKKMQTSQDEYNDQTGNYSSTAYMYNSFIRFLTCKCCRSSNGKDVDEQGMITPQDNQDGNNKIVDIPLRESGVPVGQKNVGNTCYFNSLLQIQFRNPHFANSILKFDITKHESKKLKIKNEKIEKRISTSFQMIKNIQYQFGSLLASDLKYCDPTSVIDKVVDDDGKAVPFGDQKDLIEFMLNFMERIQEVLVYFNEDLKKQEDEDKNSDRNRFKSEIYEIPAKENLMDRKFESNMQEEKKTKYKSEIMPRSNTVNMKNFSKTTGELSDFFGEHKMEIYDPKNKESHFLDHDQSFLSINLEMGCSHMYRAWEKSMVCELSEFKKDNGEKMINVLKYDWIKTAPKTFFFQLKRVAFDVQRMVPFKDNTPMEFDEEIYIDRFLEKNAREIKAMRDGIMDIESKIQNVEAKQKMLYQTDNEGKNMFELVNLSKQMLSTIDNLDKNHMLAYDSGEDDFKATKRFLESYKDQLLNSQQNLEAQLKSMKDQLKVSYEGMDKTKYILTAIIIHTGSVGGGHYYSYIKELEKWWRLSDHQCIEASKEMAFKEGIGYHGSNTNAYLLVYSIESVVKERLKLDYLLSKEQNVAEYFNILPKYVREEVVKSNKEQVIKMTIKKANTIIQQYVDWVTGFLLKVKREAIEISNETRKKTDDMYPSQKNFIYYAFDMQKSLLAKQEKKVDIDNIMKIIIFNQAYTRNLKQSEDVKDKNYLAGLVGSVYYQPLLDAIKKTDKEVRLQKVIMTQEEERLLKTMKQDYEVRTIKLYILEAVIKLMNNSDFNACIEFYEKFKNMKELISTNYTKSIMKEAFVILTLKILAMASQMFTHKKEQDQLSYDLLVMILENFHGQDFMVQTLVNQIEAIVAEVSENIDKQNMQANLRKKFLDFKTLHSNGSQLSSDINKTQDVNVVKSRITLRMENILEKVANIMECNEHFTNTYEQEIEYTWKIYFNEQYFKEKYEKYSIWSESIIKKNIYNSEDMSQKKIYDIAERNYYDYSSLMSQR